MNKKYFIYGVFIIVGVFIFYFLNSLYAFTEGRIIEKGKYTIEANDGTEFEVKYKIFYSPDPVTEIFVLYKDSSTAISTDSATQKSVNVKHLFSNENYKYYSLFNGSVENIIVCSDTKKIVKDTYESYIISFPKDILSDKNYFVGYLAPLAKERILKHNEGDYTIGYAEELIKQGNQDVMDKILFFTKNPDKINFSYYSREEILTKCQELLKIYGGVE